MIISGMVDWGLVWLYLGALAVVWCVGVGVLLAFTKRRRRERRMVRQCEAYTLNAARKRSTDA